LNVEIPLELHKRVKVKAMLEGKSLVAVVEELLEEWAGNKFSSNSLQLIYGTV
jgi:predicted HicB family RNase H-like nuclease